MATIAGVNLSSPRVLARATTETPKFHTTRSFSLNQPWKKSSSSSSSIQLFGAGSSRVVKPVAAAPDSLSEKVKESIENAKKACADDPVSGECVASWDEVEELSAEASHKRDKMKDSDPLETYCDNICGYDATNAVLSMNAAFSPAVSSNIPWAAILGNHDQESTLSREGVMKHIVGMKHALSQSNPPDVHVIDGFGNYNLEVSGVGSSTFENNSVLNLYFLDSGDYSTVPAIPGYGWIKPSQQYWFQRTSTKLRRSYMSKPEAQKGPAPGLAYFHIPLPEFANFDSSNFTGVRQEGISSASVNSGFFTTMVEAGDVKAVFTGHDHLNDFCSKLTGIQLCYAGGFGYHAYGKAGLGKEGESGGSDFGENRKGWLGSSEVY